MVSNFNWKILKHLLILSSAIKSISSYSFNTQLFSYVHWTNILMLLISESLDLEVYIVDVCEKI